MNIAFTGGGTGGHITPIASLISYGLQDTEIKRDCKLFRFGETNGLECNICKEFPEVTFVAIPAGKLRRYWTFTSFRQNCTDVRKGVAGICVAAKQLKKYHIDKLFCKGGYVALPVSIAAWFLRIPIVLHESDTYAGMANRLIAKIALTRFVGFPNALPRSIHLGQLLSLRLLQPDRSFFDAPKEKTVVLVMGGSQGATTLFSWLLTYVQDNHTAPYHFLVITGLKNNHFQTTFSNFSNVTTFGFIQHPEEMARLLQVTDIAITRGSATSLAEQHLFGIKKIIVPVPWTGGNHQRHNGVRYRDTYGDILIEQNEQLPGKLSETLTQLQHYKKSSQEPDSRALTGPLARVRQELLM